MTLVSQTLSRLTVGLPTRFRNLTLFPLLNDGAGDSPYLTLHEGLAAGILEITEMSEAGSVPTLRATNKGDRGVLIMDGEELVGAKQNRIVNVTILVAAGVTVAIPVSCVEQGRWGWRSRLFGESKQTMHAAGRRRNIDAVNASLSQAQGYRGDQHEVWSEVAAKSQRMHVDSSTGALGDVYDRHDVNLGEYERSFHPVPNQAGAIFAVNGRIRGLELFTAHRAFATVAGKLIRSYALDALERLNDQDAERTPESAAVEAFLAEVGSADESRFPGVGLGETIRLKSPAVVGSGLALGEELLHLAAFATGD